MCTSFHTSLHEFYKKVNPRPITRKSCKSRFAPLQAPTTRRRVFCNNSKYPPYTATQGLQNKILTTAETPRPPDRPNHLPIHLSIHPSTQPIHHPSSSNTSTVPLLAFKPWDMTCVSPPEALQLFVSVPRDFAVPEFLQVVAQ